MPTTVTNTVDITADPDDVWAVLADLPATRWWLPGVVAARMDGDVRVCTMADGQEIHERISELSAGHRSFRFEHLRMPQPVQHSGGTFTVTPGRRCRHRHGHATHHVRPARPDRRRGAHRDDRAGVRAVARLVAPLRGGEGGLGRVARQHLVDRREPDEPLGGTHPTSAGVVTSACRG
jgi:uncharacterized protein YndB with AHSA1/START domain